jgi:hypothetical protein
MSRSAQGELSLALRIPSWLSETGSRRGKGRFESEPARLWRMLKLERRLTFWPSHLGSLGRDPTGPVEAEAREAENGRVERHEHTGGQVEAESLDFCSWAC